MIHITVLSGAHNIIRAVVAFAGSMRATVFGASRGITDVFRAVVGILAHRVVCLVQNTLRIAAHMSSTGIGILIATVVGILIDLSIAVIINAVAWIIGARGRRNAIATALLQFASNTLHVTGLLAYTFTASGFFTSVVIVMDLLAHSILAGIITLETIAHIALVSRARSAVITIVGNLTFFASRRINVAAFSETALPRLTIRVFQFTITQFRISFIGAARIRALANHALQIIILVALRIVIRGNFTSTTKDAGVDGAFESIITVSWLVNALAINTRIQGTINLV